MRSISPFVTIMNTGSSAKRSDNPELFSTEEISELLPADLRAQVSQAAEASRKVRALVQVTETCVEQQAGHRSHD